MVKRKGIQDLINSVANNGRSSVTADCLRKLVGKKNLGNYKKDQPLFTHKKKDLKTAKPERSFIFLILLFNSN